jgi:hypothetical protein
MSCAPATAEAQAISEAMRVDARRTFRT